MGRAGPNNSTVCLAHPLEQHSRAPQARHSWKTNWRRLRSLCTPQEQHSSTELMSAKNKPRAAAPGMEDRPWAGYVANRRRPST